MGQDCSSGAFLSWLHPRPAWRDQQGAWLYVCVWLLPVKGRAPAEGLSTEAVDTHSSICTWSPAPVPKTDSDFGAPHTATGSAEHGARNPLCATLREHRQGSWRQAARHHSLPLGTTSERQLGLGQVLRSLWLKTLEGRQVGRNPRGMGRDSRAFFTPPLTSPSTPPHGKASGPGASVGLRQQQMCSVTLTTHPCALEEAWSP